jgi:putative transcription factor
VRVKNPVSAYKEVEEYVLVENYGAKIKKAREKLGWSQEDLGLKVNEKASLIGKIETEKFVPSNVITRKLEHILGITLLTKEPSIAVPKSSKTQPQELTLGDVVIIKKREKNIGGRQDSSG